jgi:hypothetical protein
MILPAGRLVYMAATRKRRRLLISTALAAVLAGVWWWMSRPQLDDRIVGTWEEIYAGARWY